MPEAGFTGPIPELNTTTVAYPGSVRTRFSQRKPQTIAYAGSAPALHYNSAQGDFVGGNFWDMRATGIRLGNPAAEQAQAPPLNPVEMGMSDAACVVYRVSTRPYRALFETVWGKQSFAVRWPAEVTSVCDASAPASTADPTPVHLDDVERGIVNATYDAMALSIAAYEASPDISPFSSKFDAVMVKAKSSRRRNNWATTYSAARRAATNAIATAAPARNLYSPTLPPAIWVPRPIVRCRIMPRTTRTMAMWPIRREPHSSTPASAASSRTTAH